MELLTKLLSIQGVSGDESRISKFIQNYCEENMSGWKCKPRIITEPHLHDCVMLVFGNPKTAVYAHIDTIGYTVGYSNNLIPIGSPRYTDSMILVGSDSQGEIETEIMLFEQPDGDIELKCIFDRNIEPGTLLSFKPHFIETDRYIQSPYLDNRLGVYVALKLAETIENGAIVFTTYEEHGGNSVGYCANYLFTQFGIHQALICDITWVTDGIKHEGGVAISLRDSLIPRKSYLNRIIEICKHHEINFQLEVESAGGSDGSILQKSHLPIDWCFIGAPEDHVHTNKETVYKYDIYTMIELYSTLLKHL
jgi:putative aminopeptidase FrvX